jgi:serine/threonine-protein kinase OSR1/STK39
MEGHHGYPLVASQYKLLEEIGYGLGSTVHRAICLPYNEVVAIKTLDLESSNVNLVTPSPSLFEATSSW